MARVGHACRGDASRRNKSDRRASRQSAATTLAAMSSGGCDSKAAVVLKAANGRRVELCTFASRLAYRELAAVLGSATQAHVASNPLLHELLGLEDMEVRRSAACRCLPLCRVWLPVIARRYRRRVVAARCFLWPCVVGPVTHSAWC